ncbi:M15 family metallopeptidase [Salinicoccus carnicancri]|uniref:M15 family metallopeptidase n=1 Tax=Salinicoccus carnicancri TaxID=558170 RepID=UPI000300AA79
MKDRKNRLLKGAALLVLVMFAAACNRMDGRYEKFDEDAPMPKELHPAVEEHKNILLDRAAERNIDAVITEGFRSVSQQDELYEQGRVSEGEIVTRSRGGESYHNYGLAVDFALRDDEGEIIWDTAYDGNGNGQADWVEVADIAKSLGFEWGGDWEDFPDYPHLQMDFGLSIDELQKGWRTAEDAG